MISALVLPSAISRAMKAFSRWACGDSASSSRVPQIGHITSSSMSVRVVCGARRQRRRRERRAEQRHRERGRTSRRLTAVALDQRRDPFVEELVVDRRRARSAPACRAGRRGSSRARRSSRRRRCARRRPSAAAGRSSPVLAQEGERVVAVVLDVDAEHGHVVAAVRARRSAPASGASSRQGVAPGGPEVDQHPVARGSRRSSPVPPPSSAGSTLSGTGSPTAMLGRALAEQPEAEQADDGQHGEEGEEGAGAHAQRLVMDGLESRLRGRSSVGRARASQARGRGFEPRRPLFVEAQRPAS